MLQRKLLLYIQYEKATLTQFKGRYYRNYLTTRKSGLFFSFEIAKLFQRLIPHRAKRNVRDSTALLKNQFYLFLTT